MIKKYYIVYNKNYKEKINKLITDFKTIGIITLRYELNEINRFDIEKFDEDQNKKTSIDKNYYIILYNKDVFFDLPNKYEDKVYTIDDLEEIYNSKYSKIFEQSEENRAKEFYELFRIKDFDNIENKLVALESFKNSYGVTKNYLTLKANTIYRNRQFREARELIDKSLEFESDDAIENFEYGILLEDYYEEYTKARKYYEKALEINPNYEEAMYNLAVLLEKIFKDYISSSKYYDKLIELGTKDERVYLNKAIFIHNTGDIKKAIELYEKAIEVNPNYIAAYNNLANIYLRELKDYTKAKELFEKALEIEKADFSIYYNLANIMKNNFSDYNKAKDYYEKSIKCEDNIYARMNLAILLEENLLEYEKALENYEVVLKFQENNIAVINRISNIYELLGDIEKAIEYSNMILEYKKNDQGAKYNIARLKQKLKK